MLTAKPIMRSGMFGSIVMAMALLFQQVISCFAGRTEAPLAVLAVLNDGITCLLCLVW